MGTPQPRHLLDPPIIAESQDITSSISPGRPVMLSTVPRVADGGAVSSGHRILWRSVPPAWGVSASVSPSGLRAPDGQGLCSWTPGPEAVLTHGQIFAPLQLP